MLLVKLSRMLENNLLLSNSNYLKKKQKQRLQLMKLNQLKKMQLKLLLNIKDQKLHTKR